MGRISLSHQLNKNNNYLGRIAQSYIFKLNILCYSTKLNNDMVESSVQDSSWISSIQRPALWVHPLGDSILMFQSRSYRWGTLGNKADLFAYNLKDNSLLWKIDSVTQEGYSSVNPLIIDDDFIYHTGHYSIQKIDALTGVIIWAKIFPAKNEHFAYANIAVEDNKIFSQPGADFLYALDAKDGRQIWKSKVACCGLTGAAQWMDNKLFYVSPPYFFSIDANNGAINYQFLSPLCKGRYNTRFSQFARTVRIPGEKKVITFDSHYIMAINIEE